ncbi:MAG: hypothetical protein ACI8XO_002636 [Verrucomicrobiales bacterium]|jgi:hypothetical protein
MNKTSTLFLASAVLAALFSGRASAAISFNRDIRPILAENCFACHGPDKHKRKAKLRFDIREGGGYEERDGVTAIVPGKPDDSELIIRVLTQDEEEIMPPPKSEKKLKPEEVALLKQWVAEGANYEGHWAYEAPRKAAAPAGVHPVDHFIDRRVKAAGADRAPIAEPHELARRLAFDLTGLPPTPAQVQAFTNAFEKDPRSAVAGAANDLLASSRYGERMAAYWLDLVRYADSIGYHSDNPMNVYLFREWVVGAFNDNMRFDDFTRWQLAGDLLPDATDAQKTASGYNHLLQTTQEGGAQDKEYRAIYAADRVRNVAGAWLGGTLGCAQCHDHKYDPYTARDFYSMAAFFADIQEPGVGKRGPEIPITTKAHAAALAKLDKQVVAAQKVATTITPAIEAAQREWETNLAGSALPVFGEWQVIGPFSDPGGAEKTHAKKFAPEERVDLKAEIDGKQWQRREQLANGQVHALDGAANAAWYLYRSVESNAASTVDLSLGSDDAIKLWQNGEVKVDHYIGRGPAPDQEKVTLILPAGTSHVLMKITNISGGAGFYFGVRGSELPGKIANLLKVPADKRDEAGRQEVAAYYAGIAPILADARAKLEAATKQRAEYDKNLPRTLVTVSMPQPRVTRILARGNWLDDSGEIVQPAVPSFLGKIDTGERRANRLDLANWVVDPSNPSTARTFVNRLWKLFFATGLASNVDDLGSQGQWPTHPELLDWLAVEFVDSGWDVKHMVELIVTSEAYARSSKTTPALRERDPSNALIAHQSRFRLDAEMIRDNALSLSGLLVEKIGGGSVKPYQPAGYWEHLNFPGRTWSADAGDNQYRRALYTHWQRSFLHPAMLAFDAPSREECTAERPRSNTPLQALVLLNDPTFVEAARAFAERIVEEGGADPAARITWAYREALSRQPSASEAKLLGDLHASQFARYTGDAAAAAALMSVGLHKAAADTPAPELASWTAVARTILNLHETITRP